MGILPNSAFIAIGEYMYMLGIPDLRETTAPGKVDNAKECSMHLSKTSQVFSLFQIFGLPLQKKELAYC